MTFDNSNIRDELYSLAYLRLCKSKPLLSSIKNESINQRQVKVMSNMKTDEKHLIANNERQHCALVIVLSMQP